MEVVDNYVVGGDSKSGCGILFEGASSDGLVKGNTLIRTAQCGINFVNTQRMTAEGNKVLDTNLVALGDTSGNVGISVWVNSKTVTPDCVDNVIKNNIISNRLPNGSYNDIHTSSKCTGTVRTGNITGGAARSLLTPERTRLPRPEIPPLSYVS